MDAGACKARGLTLTDEKGDGDPLERTRAHAHLLLQVLGGSTGPEMTQYLVTTDKNPSSWTHPDHLTVLASAKNNRKQNTFNTWNNLLKRANIDDGLFYAQTLVLGLTLLHMIAGLWSLTYSVTGTEPEEIDTDEVPLSTRPSLLQQGVKARTPLHARSSNCFSPLNETPFMLFLLGLSDRSVHIAVQSWAQSLKLAGVDLQQYGQVEAGLIKQRHYSLVTLMPELIALRYGPNPWDWGVWRESLGDRYAGVFWEMTERSERNLQGAWI